MAHVTKNSKGEVVLRDDWFFVDIRSVTEKELTDEECIEVMENIADQHDANIGINWQVIEIWVNRLLEEKEKVESRTVEVMGARWDVDYSFEVLRDPYGTGDSPTRYVVEIEKISVEGGSDDLTELLARSVVEAIEAEIIEQERE